MRAVCLTAIVAATVACTKWAPTAMPAPQVQVAGRDSVPPHRWDRIRLTLDGGQVLVLGNAARVGDSIRGAPEAEAVDPGTGSIAVPVKTVRRVEIRRFDPLRTGVFLGVLAGTTALFAAMGPMPDGFNVSIPCGLLGEPCPNR